MTAGQVYAAMVHQPNNTLYVANMDWKIKKPLLRRALYSLFTRHGKVRCWVGYIYSILCWRTMLWSTAGQHRADCAIDNSVAKLILFYTCNISNIIFTGS